jgi:hypothetical protein
VPKPEIWLSPRFHAAVAALRKADVTRVEEALNAVPDCFGRPHAHAGLSIRRLTGNIFECRASLHLRLLFRARPGALEFFFVGNHDAVRRLIRDL